MVSRATKSLLGPLGTAVARALEPPADPRVVTDAFCRATPRRPAPTRPLLDNALWQHAFDAGHAGRTARGIAGAITVRAALTTWHSNAGQAVTAGRTGVDALRRIGCGEGDIDAISRALHRPRTLDPIRERMAPQETRTHA